MILIQTKILMAVINVLNSTVIDIKNLESVLLQIRNHI